MGGYARPDHLVGDSGHVYSYDVREEMQDIIARKNVTELGLDSRVTFKLRDTATGFEEADVDLGIS